MDAVGPAFALLGTIRAQACYVFSAGGIERCSGGHSMTRTKYCQLEIPYWPAYPHVPRGFCGQYWRVRVVLENVRSHYWRCGQYRCLFLTTPADTRDTGYLLSRYWRVRENCLFTSQLGACDGRLRWCLPSLLINPEGLICI